MLSDAVVYYTQPHFMFWPGMAIFVTVLAFNLFGDGLRDASIHEPIDRNHHRGDPPTNKKGFRNEPFEILASQRLAAAGVSAALLLAACGGGGTGGEQGPGTQAGASGFNAASTSVVNPSDKKGGTLKFANPGTGTPSTPGETYYAWSWNFARLYGRSLMMFKSAPGKEGNQLVPDLAEGPGQASSDAKTWTYKLRQVIKFEDGTEVTSADAKYAVLRSIDKETFPNGPAYWEARPRPAGGLQGPVQVAEHEHRLGY